MNQVSTFFRRIYRSFREESAEQNSEEQDGELPLVDVKQFTEAIDGLSDLDEQKKKWLKGRWLHMVQWWNKRASESNTMYRRLRLIVIAGGVTIPVLSAISLAFTEWSKELQIIVAIVSAVVAGCAAWEGVANYGQVWLDKRKAAELLKVEGWLFFQQAGKYKGKSPAERYPEFAAEVERMIAEEVGQYVTRFQPSVEQAQQTATQISDDIKAQLAEFFKLSGLRSETSPDAGQK